ncbi:hypothetical protein SEA_CHUBSTER_76 [Arthrobacter phage Chubster]|uniref:Uncharacterized protein n=1 Tax=Arthrobacter phage Chubster TaxID=1897527 RepID=A0A1I9SCQ0_9CAUD|nr:hypothetical protein SEA_CHUBSTER_76 [Arthrobacter phage Chubster]
MKQGKYWCLVLTIAAGVMFATEIWVADGRYAAMGWLAVGGAIIAGLVGITQAVKSEAKELKPILEARTFKLYEIAKHGLPDMDDAELAGRVAFIFDGCAVSGWPLSPPVEFLDVYQRAGWPSEILWEADSDVGRSGPFSGVTHWLEFPEPLSRLAPLTPPQQEQAREGRD